MTMDLEKSTLSEWCVLAHSLSKSKGWHDVPETEGEYIARALMNIHAELSELWESYRNGGLRAACDKTNKMREIGLPELSALEEEAADIFIRLCDFAERLKIDLARAVATKHLFNASRPHRHGGKLA